MDALLAAGVVTDPNDPAISGLSASAAASMLLDAVAQGKAQGLTGVDADAVRLAAKIRDGDDDAARELVACKTIQSQAALQEALAELGNKSMEDPEFNDETKKVITV